MKIDRYKAYKDSGIEWLSEVPEHWKIKRIKDFSSVVRGGSPRPAGDLKFYEGNIPFLKVGDLTANEEVYLSTHIHTIKEAGLTNTRFTPKNTLLLTNSGATLGVPKICTFPTTFNDGIAAFIYLNKIDKIFLFYILKNHTKYYLNQAALGQGQPNLNTDIIGNTFICFPPLPEQKAIAHYLETKTAQIDRKIDLLTQKATQYGNLKQSLINEAVTRGLDRSVVMKDSGIEWIGEVPEHWGIRRVKDIFAESKNKAGGESSLYKVLSLTMKGVIVRDLESNKGKMPASFDGYQIVQKNNIVFCLFDMDVTPRIVGYVEQEGIITSAYTIVKSKTHIQMKYFYYYFLDQNRNKSLLSVSKTLRSTLTFDIFSLIELPLPPLSEQKAIADCLDTKTAQIDQIIQTINTQIEKLKELRKTLINDVVTGKIKVV